MAFQLLIARGNSEGQQFVVVQPVVRIGRDDDNDVVLSDSGVSRQHTRIFDKNGRPFVEDLGSSNGTLLNGERVVLPRELRSGDALAIGSALINFVELEEDKRPGLVPGFGKAGMLPPPPARTDEDIVTASGEEEPMVPWETKPKKLMYEEEAEVTAPVGRPLFAPEDNTQPLGKPLIPPLPGISPERRKLEPDLPRGSGDSATLNAHDPRKAELGAPGQPSPSLINASVLKRVPDVSEQKTAMALPDLDPVVRRIEGPTNIVATPQAPSINKLLLTDAEASSNSLAPLDLTGSDFKAFSEPTVADAKPIDDVTDEGPRLVPRAPLPMSRPMTDAIPVKETTADRSRRRRIANESLGAQAAYWWTSLPTKSQAIITGVCSLIATIVIISLVQVFRPEAGVSLPSEPDRLHITSERIRHSFGLGDGVDYPRVDSKQFSFDFVTPTDAAILVHYLAQDIDRDEVAIIVNNAEVAFVPPDIGVPDREIETLIPPRVLKRGEKNTLVFDNVRNPPSKERWRVGDIWLELLPVPPASSAEAIKRARDLARQAGQLYAQRDVGSENVFRSWKAYRQSWQLLLVVPEEQRATLFDQTRRKADEIGMELDRQCGALMLEAKKQMELKNPERAKEILLEVAQYFPTNEHRCHALANEKLDEYQL